MIRSIAALNILAAWWIVLGFSPTSEAAELVMIDSRSCPYCARWHRDVGSIYASTPEGRIAPLRRVTYRQWPSDLKHIRREALTPTFILVDRGREVARIRGYSGKEWFWHHLRNFIGLLPARAATDTPATTGAIELPPENPRPRPAILPEWLFSFPQITP